MEFGRCLSWWRGGRSFETCRFRAHHQQIDWKCICQTIGWTNHHRWLLDAGQIWNRCHGQIVRSQNTSHLDISWRINKLPRWQLWLTVDSVEQTVSSSIAYENFKINCVAIIACVSYKLLLITWSITRIGKNLNWKFMRCCSRDKDKSVILNQTKCAENIFVSSTTKRTIDFHFSFSFCAQIRLCTSNGWCVERRQNGLHTKPREMVWKVSDFSDRTSSASALCLHYLTLPATYTRTEKENRFFIFHENYLWGSHLPRISFSSRYKSSYRKSFSDRSDWREKNLMFDTTHWLVNINLLRLVNDLICEEGEGKVICFADDECLS